jgi:Zn-dependent protease with chaperone function
MFETPRHSFLGLLVIALTPGVVSWLLGYRLIRHLSDPALPELLAAHRRRMGIVFGITLTAIGWLSISSGGRVVFLIISGVVVSYAGLLAAAYPLRRALYGETWSFLSYLAFYPRTIAGVFGFWLMLASLPALAVSGGTHSWLPALMLGGVLVVWNLRYADVVRWSLRSQPLPEGALLSDCRALADRCGLHAITFERIPLHGGVIANAMALPSLTGSSVLFTDILLERFDHRELLAIAAHELAHFDHYNATHLRRTRAGNHLLIAAGVAAGPVAQAAGTGWGLFPAVLWLFAIVGSLALRARGKQRQETMCDLKAVELTGDADAVVSGLTKLYTIARLPRRLDNRTEQSATHPSLARRIRDIRKAAGSQPAPLADAHSVTSSDRRSTVTFDPEGLQWVDCDGVGYTLSYAHLTELRVDATDGRTAHLVAVGPSARRWELALEVDDIARVQSILDTVDGKLADPPPRRFTLVLGPSIKQLVVLATVTIMLSLSQVGMVVVAVIAWAKPTVPMFVGAGVAALTTAALMFRDLRDSDLAELWLPIVVLALVFFGLAWSARGTPRDGTRKYLALLGGGAACSVAMVLAHGLTVVDLHRAARDLPSATVLLVAIAGGLLCSSRREEQASGLAAAAAALALTAIASTEFLDRFGSDPFLGDPHRLRWVELTTQPIATLDVPPSTSRIALSPRGEYVAVYDNQERDADAPGTVQVGRVGASLTSVAANDIAFVNDEALLILRSAAHSTLVKAATLAPDPRVAWQHQVEHLSSSSITVDRARGRWSLLGWDDEQTIVRVEGDVDGSAPVMTRWPVAQDRDGLVTAMTSSGAAALVLETRYQRGWLGRLASSRSTWAQMMMPPRASSHYATIANGHRESSVDSKFDVTCVADVASRGTLTCTAYDGTRTHIATIAAGSPHVQSMGFVDGRFVSDGSMVEGWLTGWIAARPAAVHLATATVFHTPASMRALRLLPATDDRLIILTFRSRQMEASIYAPLRDRQRVEPVAENRAAIVGR